MNTKTAEITATDDAWREAAQALALLRRNWARENCRADADGWSRDDIGELIARINTREGDTLAFSAFELDVMWHATSHFATAVGNTNALRRLEAALIDSEVDL